MMQKLRAFTLMELLIGMIVSSIVIGFGYGAYSLIYRQYLNYKEVKVEVVQAMQLNSILANDFESAQLISFNDNQLAINRKDHFPLIYDFNDSIVLRKENELVDTFKLTPSAIAASFIFPDEKAMVTGFSFESKVLEETEQFVFTKKYSSETLMNYEIQLKK